MAKTAALVVAYATVALAFGLLSLPVIGLSGYVVMGGSETLPPVGSFVLFPSAAGAVDVAEFVAGAAPFAGKTYVAIPLLGYVVRYAETYVSPAAIGIVMWCVFGVAARASALYRRMVRSRMPM